MGVHVRRYAQSVCVEGDCAVLLARENAIGGGDMEVHEAAGRRVEPFSRFTFLSRPRSAVETCNPRAATRAWSCAHETSR